MKKQFRITLNNKTFDVVAEVVGEDVVPVVPNVRSSAAPRPAARSAAAAAPAAAAPKPKAAAAGGSGAIASPLAGKVVSLDVKVGDAVKVGQQVITLEAMKMNTVVSSTAEGTVQAIHVAAGDPVEEGQALLTIA